MAGKLIQALVGPECDGMRLDAFLASQPELPSRSACVKLIEEGAVSINSTCANDKSERLCLGDRVEVLYTLTQTEDGLLVPNPDIPLDIRFEDKHVIVVSKQAGLVCHPSPGHVDDTLANALVAHCGYEHLGRLQGEDRPGIVHRLDQDTTGLMLCAKSDEVQGALQDLIRLRAVDRRYITLVHGNLAHDSGTIVTGIARSKRDPLRMAVSDSVFAREAITDWLVLERFEAGKQDDGYSLLECHLWTGRTHQIRLHMRHIGHAVVGDVLYGRGGKHEREANLGLTRQFLHSWRISFEHPMTGETLTFEDSLPCDLAELLSKLESRSLGQTDKGKEICKHLDIDIS